MLQGTAHCPTVDTDDLAALGFAAPTGLLASALQRHELLHALAQEPCAIEIKVLPTPAPLDTSAVFHSDSCAMTPAVLYESRRSAHSGSQRQSMHNSRGQGQKPVTQMTHS